MLRRLIRGPQPPSPQLDPPPQLAEPDRAVQFGEDILAQHADLDSRLGDLDARSGQAGRRTDQVEKRADLIEDTLRAIDLRFEAVETSTKRLQEGAEDRRRVIDARLAELDGYRMARAAQMGAQQRLTEKYMHSLVSLVERVDTLQSGVDELQSVLSLQAEHGEQEIARVDERLVALEVIDIRQQQQRLTDLLREQVELAERLAAINRQVDTLARSGAGRGRLLARLAETVDQLAGPAATTTSVPSTLASMLDALYLEFEDRARGSREEIKGRQAAHLPLLSDVGAGTPDRPVLDIGAGRGEWLELLGERGLCGRGIDLNAMMVSLCRELELPCEEGDALAALRALPDGALGLVSGFHIIEHLPFETFVAILDEAYRALAPGGAILLETPDPANVLVGSHTFYLDPTHRNPMPSELVRIIVEARGYAQVEIRHLHPSGGSFDGEDRALTAQLDALFYGPQDYAVIGRKP